MDHNYYKNYLFFSFILVEEQCDRWFQSALCRNLGQVELTHNNEVHSSI